MSSRTPEECVELALDTSADPDDREDAIDALELANECDELAELVLNEDVEDRYRQRALRSMGSTQCDSTLQRLIDEESLDPSLHENAEEILQNVGND